MGPVTRSFDACFFFLRLIKRFSKQSRRRWFQTLSRPFWRHGNDWENLHLLFCHLLHIHSGKTGILFSLLLCSWWVQIVGYVQLTDRVRLFVHYTISLSSLCKLIWRHWTYKMPGRNILSRVWVRLSIFSQLSIIKYMGLCVYSLPIPLWWLREYILCLIIIIKSEVWTAIHCLGLGHETMVCAVCLSIFLFF